MKRLNLEQVLCFYLRYTPMTGSKSAGHGEPSGTGPRLGTPEGLLDLLQEGVILATEDGHVSRANSAALAILGTWGDGSRVRRVPSLIGIAAWEAIQAGEYGDSGIDFTVRSADGTQRRVKATVSPVTADDGSELLALVLRDVTAQRAAERELGRHRVWDTPPGNDCYSELTELLNRYRQLFENMGEGIVGVRITDVPRFNLANPAAERLFGVRPGGLTGRKLSDFCVPEDLAKLKEQQAQREAGEISTYLMALTRPDGERRTIQVTGSPLLSSSGEFLGSFSLLLDVTDRLRYEQELLASRNLLAHAHRLVRLGTWEWEIATGDVVWSEHVYDIFGLDPETFQPTIERILELYPEEDRGSAQELIRRATDSHETGEYEQKYNHPDGSLRIYNSTFEGEYNARGDLVRIIGTIQDITERKRIENELRASEARIQGIIKDSPMAIGITVDRVIQEINDQTCRLTGYDREELIGQNSRILYASQEEFERVGREILSQTKLKGTCSVECRWVRKDGSVKDVLLHATPFDPADLSKGIINNTVDLTERKAAEEARLSLERQVQQSQKLESLGILAGGIAHDFNNLLMTIIGNADLGLHELGEESPVRANLEGINSAARRAAGLARQMLAYSGKGKFVIESIQLNKLIKEMADLLEVSISKKADLRFNPGEDIPEFDGDSNQVSQVVLNLITNASDSLEDNPGTITVTTGVMECTREYLSNAQSFLQSGREDSLPDGRYVFFEVQDSGCGMDAETRSRIFEPFYTTKFTGRGLGLAAVMGIVNGHNGAIQIDSEPGNGSTFKVLFPAGSRPATGKQVQQHAAPRSDGWQGSGLVLIVDDDTSISRISRQMYKMMGFTTINAADGLEAIKVFREYSDEVVLVQLDLTMPQMGGEEAFAELRRINPAVRVLLTSGYNQQDATQRFTGEGLAGFIQKPFTYHELRAAVQGIIES